MTTPKVGVHVLLGGSRIATVRAPPSGSPADPAGDVLYYHRDLRGSVVATTLSGGRVGVKYRYGPYGEAGWQEVVDATADSELGFTGGLRLGWTPGSPQSGSLVLLGARVYHAELRRWVQADTVEVTRYTYAAGDPVNFVDPSGREPPAPGAPQQPQPGAAPNESADKVTFEENGWSCQVGSNGVICVTEAENTAPMPGIAVLPGVTVHTGTAANSGTVDLYIRSFAPWASFGGGFRGDNRGFTTDLRATSRMWGRVTVNLQTGVVSAPAAGSSGTTCAGPPCSWFRNQEKVADVTISVVSTTEGASTITLAGANPLVAGAPDIDLSLTLQLRPGGFISGTLRGDAFPNPEVFAVGASGPKMLLTYQTLGGPLTGPALYLPGANSVWMGSFDSHYP
jgi:RHS repeat-associated protein